MASELLRLAAFARNGRGGNPAGVWLGAALPSRRRMQRIAADVGYSETAFNERVEEDVWVTRYYSPRDEVPFCGHATIATGVALGGRYGPGTYRLETAVGPVPVQVSAGADGVMQATLTSVEPMTRAVTDDLLDKVLATFGWTRDVLDPVIPAGLAYAGAWHLVVPLATRAVLASMAYDFNRLLDVMQAGELTTIQVVHRQDDVVFHARDPFPVGGVVEDPATGAAAAAFGAHLRAHHLVRPPTSITIHQGEDLGSPSIIRVDVPVTGGISVTGTAIPMESTPAPIRGSGPRS